MLGSEDILQLTASAESSSSNSSNASQEEEEEEDKQEERIPRRRRRRKKKQQEQQQQEEQQEKEEKTTQGQTTPAAETTAQTPAAAPTSGPVRLDSETIMNLVQSENHNSFSKETIAAAVGIGIPLSDYGDDEKKKAAAQAAKAVQGIPLAPPSSIGNRSSHHEDSQESQKRMEKEQRKGSTHSTTAVARASPASGFVAAEDDQKKAAATPPRFGKPLPKTASRYTSHESAVSHHHLSDEEVYTSYAQDLDLHDPDPNRAFPRRASADSSGGSTATSRSIRLGGRKGGGTPRRSSSVLSTESSVEEQQQDMVMVQLVAQEEARERAKQQREGAMAVAMRTPSGTVIPPPVELQDQSTSQLVANMNQPVLDRQRRAMPQAQPGAIRIPGIAGSASEDDDNDDNEEYDYSHDEHHEDASSGPVPSYIEADASSHAASATITSGGSSTHGHSSSTPSHATISGDTTTVATPIQAFLISDDQDQRQAELEAREAMLRQKELELERKMQEMNLAQVVTNAVPDSSGSDADPVAKPKKGFFARFRPGKKGNSKKPPPSKARSASGGEKRSSDEDAIHSLVGKQEPARGSPLPAKRPPHLTRNSSVTSSHSVSTDGSNMSGDMRSSPAVAKGPTRRINSLTLIPSPDIPVIEMRDVHVGEYLGTNHAAPLPLAASKLTGAFESYNVLGVKERTGYSGSFSPRQQQRLVHCSRQIQDAKGWSGIELKRAHRGGQAASSNPKMERYALIRLQAEACLLSHLQHEHLCTAHAMSDLCSADGQQLKYDFFFLTDSFSETFSVKLNEWRKASNLNFLSAGGKQQLERYRFLVGISSALSYMHSEHHLAYTCLHPETIGRAANGKWKLFYLDSCVQLSSPSSSSKAPKLEVNPYIAPEIPLLQLCTCNSDTYSFAILAWEVLTGREAYSDLMVHEFMPKVLQGGRRPKLAGDRSLSPEIQIMLKECWDIEPSSRLSMTEVFLRLEQFSG